MLVIRPKLYIFLLLNLCLNSCLNVGFYTPLILIVVELLLAFYIFLLMKEKGLDFLKMKNFRIVFFSKYNINLKYISYEIFLVSHITHINEWTNML